MSSIKQLIINEFMRIACEHPPYNSKVLTAEESRDEFIRRLIAALFPESPEVDLSGFPPAPPLVQEQTVSIPEAAPKKTKKTKNAPAPETAALSAPEVAAEPTPADAPAVDVEPVAQASPEKKKRAPMTEEAKAAMKAKKEATLAAKQAAAGGQHVSPPQPESALETSGSNAAAGGSSTPVPDVKEKKTKKTKPAEDANLAKVDPTWKKHLKHADKDHAKELEPALLTYLNALSKDEFNAKKAEEHVADFIASRVTKAVEADDGKVEADVDVVEFNGKEYYVNPETKRVYEGEGTCDADGNWTNYKGVGYVGMAAFADMKLE
jgi:hypothetical protein